MTPQIYSTREAADAELLPIGKTQRHPLPRPLLYTPALPELPGFRRASGALGWPHDLLVAGTTSGNDHRACLSARRPACAGLWTQYSARIH
jgi:hypothetical protein